MVRMLMFVATLCIALPGLSSAQDTRPAGSTAPPPAATGEQPPVDDLAQMQADLNQLESLHNLMSSEIEFLHDQNLQILLRTNAQMWTVVTRDLRRLIAREEQRRTAGQPQPGAAHPKSTDERGTHSTDKPAR